MSISDEEDFLDPNDLMILENEEHDPDYEPEEEDVINYAQYLGFDLPADLEFLHIAENALKAPLPEGWHRAVVKGTEALYYINLEDNSLHEYSPIDMYARQLFEKEKLKKLESNKAKPIPPKSKQNLPPVGGGGKAAQGGKLAPLNPLKGGKKERIDLDTSNPMEKPEKHEKKAKKMMNIDIDVSNSEINDAERKEYQEDFNYESVESHPQISEVGQSPSPKKANSPRRIDKKSQQAKISPRKLVESPRRVKDEDKYYDEKAKEKEKSVEKISPTKQKFQGLKEKKDNSENNTKNEDELIKTSDLVMNENSNKATKSHDKTQSPVHGTAGVNSKFSPDNDHNNKEEISEIIEGRDGGDKQAYLKTKLDELEKHALRLKDKYNGQLKDYKRFKNVFKSDMKREYEMKIRNELARLQRDYEKEVQNTENEYHIKTESYDEEERFKQECRYEQKRQQEIEIERLDDKMAEIKREKQSIIDEIDIFHKIQEQTQASVSNAELNEVKILLEEKFDFERNNLDRKYKEMERELENDEELKFNKEVEMLQKHTEYSIELQEKTMRNSYAKILDDYQQTLEEDYISKTKAILNDMESHQTRDVKKYAEELEREKNNLIKLQKEDILDLEREYFTTLSKSREDLKKTNTFKDRDMTSNFDTVVSNYENLKKKVQVVIEELQTATVLQIQEIVKNYNDIRSEEENRVEDFVVTRLDELTVEYQKKKNLYELKEVEHKEKSLFIEYLIEVGGESTSIMKENPLNYNLNEAMLLKSEISSNNVEREENILKNLLQLCKETQRSYKQKYKQLIAKPLYSGLENKDLIRCFVSQKKTSSREEFNFKKSIELGNFINSKSFVDKQDEYNYNPLKESSAKFNERNKLITLQDNCNNEQSYSSLIPDIINFVNDGNKMLLNSINSDLNGLKMLLEKEFNDLSNERKMHEDLRTAVRRQNYGIGDSLQLNISASSSYGDKNSKFSTYLKIIEEDRSKLTMKETRYDNKKIILTKIEAHFEDILLFIRSNCRSISDQNNIFNERLRMIKKQVEDFNKNFNQGNLFEEKLLTESNATVQGAQNFSFNKDNNETQKERERRGNAFGSTNINMNVNESNKYETFDGARTRYHQASQPTQQVHENINMVQSSMNFGGSSKLSRFENTLGSRFEFSQQPSTTSSFNNFYQLYNKKSLHDDLKMPSYAQYFSNKKNQRDIDQKSVFWDKN